MIMKIMNNIIVDKELIFIKDEEINEINIKKNSIINIFNSSINNIKINIDDNLEGTLNIFKDNLDKDNVDVYVNSNSKLNINYSFINKDKYELNVNTKFMGLSGELNVAINCYNDGGNTNIVVDGYVDRNNTDNVLNEKIKIVNVNGGVSCNPNMYIDTSRVVANHANSIGNISLDELFYLESKGIEKDNAIKLIRDGFVISNMSDLEFINLIKDYINGR